MTCGQTMPSIESPFLRLNVAVAAGRRLREQEGRILIFSRFLSRLIMAIVGGVELSRGWHSGLHKIYTVTGISPCHPACRSLAYCPACLYFLSAGNATRPRAAPA